MIKKLFYICLSVLCVTTGQAQDVKTYIPPQAYQYFDTIKLEQKRLFPSLPYKNYFPALIEHESCLSLKHRRCWNPSSKLQSKLETGIGLSQLTKAYNKDGTIRFDIISDLKKRHSRELKELSWETVELRPDLQIRSMILLSRGNYNSLYAVKDPFERLAMADAAYNGGLPSVNQRRRICGLREGCNPQLWFDNLEHIVVKSTKPLYGNRSAQEINTHHVKDVLKTRMPKYDEHF